MNGGRARALGAPWLTLLLLWVTVAAQAAEDLTAAASTELPTAELVRNKEILVRQMLASPTVAQIGQSDHEEAKRLLGQARADYQRGADALRGNDLALANRSLNAAIAAISRASQLGSVARQQARQQRNRYSRVLESTESLRLAYQRRAATAGVDANRRALVERIDALIAEARRHAGMEQMEPALDNLGQAEQLLLAAFNGLIGSTTLTYAQKFDTPEQEFQYELERNHSYSELVPVALFEFKPPAQARQSVAGYLEQNQTLLEQAKAAARLRDYALALKVVREGTGYLQRALLAAGLVLPSAAGME